MPFPHKLPPIRYDLISPSHSFWLPVTPMDYPTQPANIVIQLSSISSSEEKKPYIWRMQNPEARKYQLFPREKHLPPVAIGKQLDPEQAFAMAMGQPIEKSDKPSVANGLRMRIKEHNLTRRRKISVPELGPMTTVQEVAMDSRKCINHFNLQLVLTRRSYNSRPACVA